MFNKLFGAQEKLQAEAPIDVIAATDKLEAKIEDIDLRFKKLENLMTDYKAKAIEKNKNKDKTGAIYALRKSKMFEKQLDTL